METHNSCLLSLLATTIEKLTLEEYFNVVMTELLSNLKPIKLSMCVPCIFVPAQYLQRYEKFSH